MAESKPRVQLQGYLRSDGRKGIRNQVMVAYLVECSHFVVSKIVRHFETSAPGVVHEVGFPGCYPNEHAERVLSGLATHPNVGAVLFVSLGCESMNREKLDTMVKNSGRPSRTIGIQEVGGTQNAIDLGIKWVSGALETLNEQTKVPMDISELSVATICGGSDGTSGISANPAVGLSFDQLVDMGATCIFEETGELIGCESHMSQRGATPEISEALVESVNKAAEYYSVLGFASFAPGNADGGLTTIEEKSLGAYSKSGSRPIEGIIKPAELPNKNGLWLMDVVPDGEVRFGFPNIADNAEITELIACGAHVVLFTTGRGSVVGSAISPVIKVCANPETYARMSGDMDINAGKVLQGSSLDSVSDEITDLVIAVARGNKTKSEALGHAECLITYK
ncbi:hydrolase [Vibrio nigripulchritudo]|uniref:UxaA family hydrolase n=1 Tax=Vibrio nigripulchritudo TaxID=28173 RepID=UPI00190BFF09|nr:UxaA family hydrolase [Vibrio nigripulchritudo]BCL70181.1 hydrolase [Vibrio nigripulchritudo]BDU31531.1 hydrolase [Vibrio nigripulchritudo]